MASPGHALIRKHFRRRFGLGVRPVSIRPKASWSGRIGFWFAVLAVGGGGAAWVFEAGQKLAGFDQSTVSFQLDSVRQQFTQAKEEVARLRVDVSTAEGQLQVERSTVDRLSGQMAVLQQENSALKQELAFFEGLAAGDRTGSAVPSITRATVMHKGRGELRYRILVLNPLAGRKGEILQGELQFELKLLRSNQSVTMTLPPKVGLQKPQFPVEVKHFIRLEGALLLPAEAQVVSAEVRFIQGGQILVRQTMTIES